MQLQCRNLGLGETKTHGRAERTLVREHLSMFLTKYKFKYSVL